MPSENFHTRETSSQRQVTGANSWVGTPGFASKSIPLMCTPYSCAFWRIHCA